jgi:hypothetical protein
MKYYQGDAEMVECAQPKLEFAHALEPNEFWPKAQRFERNPEDEELLLEFHALPDCRRDVLYGREDKVEGLKPWGGLFIEMELENCKKEVRNNPDVTRPCVVKGYRKELTYTEFELARSRGSGPGPKTERSAQYVRACLAAVPRERGTDPRPSVDCGAVAARMTRICAETTRGSQPWLGGCLAGGAAAEEACSKNPRMTCLAATGVFGAAAAEEAEKRGSKDANATLVRVIPALQRDACLQK